VAVLDGDEVCLVIAGQLASKEDGRPAV
jgi:hypothetical protein